MSFDHIPVETRGDRSIDYTLSWCASNLPTDTTVKSETERRDTASVSITKLAPLSFQSVRPTGPVVSVLDGDAKKGLWADPQPVLPWEWRKHSR
jgi:hypothetical protein